MPGQTYRLEVDLNVTSNLFKAVRMYCHMYSSRAVFRQDLSAT